jgi:hypothetical protein
MGKPIHPVFQEVFLDLFDRIIAESGDDVVLLDWGIIDRICEGVSDTIKERDSTILMKTYIKSSE